MQTDAFPDQNYSHGYRDELDFRDYRYCRDYHGIGYLDNHSYRGDYYANYDSCGGEDGDGYVGKCAVNL